MKQSAKKHWPEIFLWHIRSSTYPPTHHLPTYLPTYHAKIFIWSRPRFFLMLRMLEFLRLLKLHMPQPLAIFLLKLIFGQLTRDSFLALILKHMLQQVVCVSIFLANLIPLTCDFHAR